MKTRSTALFALLALLLVPAMMFCQEQPAEHGTIELGGRTVWGSVYGRPDLSFKPSLLTSGFNQYSDLRNGVFVRNFNVSLDHLLGSNFLSVQSRSTVYKDQSLLASFGKYGSYKAQFRYDEMPHTYTNTARTLFTEMTPGVFTFPLALRSALQGTSAANIPGVTKGLVSGFNFVTPQTTRKAGSGNFSLNASENWNLAFSFARENQTGSRPIGYVLNSSPSASASAGYGVELPEPIDYNLNTINAGTEYGRKNWGVQFGYTGSLFENNISKVVFDNPFANSAETAARPLTGQAALYPSNSAHNLNFAGALDPNKYIHIIGSISPGWLRQNDAFLPYTSNSALLPLTNALPAATLNGQRNTLAMNYTVSSRPVKNVEFTAKYRQYDYNNDTPVLHFTPVQGDVGTPNLAAPVENTPYAFFKKNFEAAGTWFFFKRSSAKVGYEWEGMDRDHRDVNHTSENSVFATLDLVPRNDVQFRLAYRHSDRKPDVYENESEELLPAERRFDENARVRDRADASLSYSPTDKLSFTSFWGTTQDNYNLRDNSINGVAYGFMNSSALPYYSYGLLKDIGYNYGFGVDYAATKQVSVFGEYTREKYNNNMVSRQRNVNTVNGAELFDTASDTPGNDWTSANRDLIDTYATGVDLYLSKKVYITTYYTLSAGKGLNRSATLGNAAMFASGGQYFVPANGAIPAAKFLVTTIMDFPETTTRLHEVGTVFKFKLTKNLMPKFEYRLQQSDSNDFQTSPMNPYMGISNPGAVSFYPNINVFDASAARFLFLGADQPSYRAHTASFSLEYHF